jgi:hypothetical protein
MLSRKESRLLDRELMDYTMLLKLDTLAYMIRIGGNIGAPRSLRDIIYLYIGGYRDYEKYDTYEYYIAHR